MRKIFIATGVICFFLVSVMIQTSTAQDVISGCYNQRVGKLRIVSDSSECKKSENPIQWNAQGPPGECECPLSQQQLDEIYERIEYLESIQPIPNARFTDMGDGTIRDNNTGLIWLKDANCLGVMNLPDALAAADSLAHGQCELTDGSVVGQWRLPTQIEWEDFYSTVYYNPALVNTYGDAQWSEGDAFTGVQSRNYWSSTEYEQDHTWYANMAYGYMGYTSAGGSNYVWSVRNEHESRFTDMGDGTVRDNSTGLIWLKDANCFARSNWTEAMNEASLLENGYCSLTDGSTAGDWRLPRKTEWETFMSSTYDNPALVNTTGDGQWSESP